MARWDADSQGTSSFGVPLLRWPVERSRAQELECSGRPFLLLVPAQEPPPLSAYALMDWVRSPVDGEELVTRQESLEARFVRSAGGPSPHFDEETGRLTFGRAVVDVSSSKIDALRLLVASYRDVVHAAELRMAFGLLDDSPEKLLAGRVVRLRRAVRTVGLDIVRVRGVGFFLEPLRNGER